MQRTSLFRFFCVCFLVASATAIKAEGLSRSTSQFYYEGYTGQVKSARIIRRYYGRTVYPSAAVNFRLDPRLRRAATVAQERANARTKARCWRYVKQALSRRES